VGFDVKLLHVYALGVGFSQGRAGSQQTGELHEQIDIMFLPKKKK